MTFQVRKTYLEIDYIGQKRERCQICCDSLSWCH